MDKVFITREVIQYYKRLKLLKGIRNKFQPSLSKKKKKGFLLVTALASSYTIRPKVYLGLMPFWSNPY